MIASVMGLVALLSPAAIWLRVVPESVAGL
jgi:hypothetical protein